MSVDAIAAIVFIVALALFLILKRKQVNVQGVFPVLFIVMYRSAFGLKSMRSFARRHPGLLRVLGWAGVIVGFTGMIFICAQLVYATFGLIFDGAPPSVQPVLPFSAKGVFYVPFLYWVISIFLLALVHEFAHGIMSNLYKVKVKSSGFAFLCLFLPVIPAAFVEPEEVELKKKSFSKQLAVFAAGPFANILFALLMIGVVFSFAPTVDAAFNNAGVEIVRITEDSPADLSGLEQGEVITAIGDNSVPEFSDFQTALRNASPDSEMLVTTSERAVMVNLSAHPKNSSWAYLGVVARQHTIPDDKFVEEWGVHIPYVVKWFSGLFFWLFMLNLGIGLFNLLPIGPVDGGRMFQLVCLKFFKNEKTALKVWAKTSMFFILLILFNLFAGFIL